MADNRINALVGAFLVLLMAVCVGGGYWLGLHTERDVPEKIVVREKVVRDTVRIDRPVVRDSIIVRTEKVSVPIVRHDTTTLLDTVKVEVPITQKRYSDSTYTAWVSGYMPNLDSISIVQRKSIREIAVTKKENRRLSIGVQVGYGVGLRSKSVEPYAGIGLAWRLW